MRETERLGDRSGQGQRRHLLAPERQVRKQEPERQAEHEPIDRTAHDVDSLPYVSGKSLLPGRRATVTTFEGIRDFVSTPLSTHLYIFHTALRAGFPGCGGRQS